MLYSFHDHGKRRGCFGTLFFSFGEGVQTKIAKDRNATTPFPLRSTEIFLTPQMWCVVKVAEIRRAIISLFLQLFHSLIRKCQDYIQRTTHQKSFGRGGQRRVARLGRKKLAEQTTFKQI